MTTEWTIRHRSNPVTVSGFARAQNALDHTRKHYLAPRERWEHVDPNATEARRAADRVAKEHGAVSPAFYAFLAEVAVAYVACVRAETETAVRVELVSYVDESGRRVKRLEVVTRNGVYASFSAFPADGMSDLRTALRHCVRTIKNPRAADFLNCAHARLAARLAGARFSDD